MTDWFGLDLVPTRTGDEDVLDSADASSGLAKLDVFGSGDGDAFGEASTARSVLDVRGAVCWPGDSVALVGTSPDARELVESD